MAELMQQRRDTTATWLLKNPIMAEGEIGFEWTTEKKWKIKVGDAVRAFKDLPYLIADAPIPVPPDPVDPVVVPKLIWTVDGSYTVTVAGDYRFLAVAGGGGGCACIGCGGGSGQSTDIIRHLNVGDKLYIFIGKAGVGSVAYANNSDLPSNGAPYAGKDGGDTRIGIVRTNGQEEVIALIGGKGATNPSPINRQYRVGTGENNGGQWSTGLFTGSGAECTWSGGDGAPSPFGAGGKGGIITYQGLQVTDGGDGCGYGAGGGGCGFILTNAQKFSWSSAGDGIQGVFILEYLKK